MITCLLAYDAQGHVVGTLDHMVQRDPWGQVIGLHDFDAFEAQGGKLLDLFVHSDAVGAGTWPEWIGSHAHAFRVEVTPAGTHKRITALVHRISGHRRERHQIEYAISSTPIVNKQRDIRHIVGGPQRPLNLDTEGRTLGRRLVVPSHIPLIGIR